MSVVLVVGRLRNRAVRCLHSLLEQDSVGDLEIILIDLDADRSPSLPGSSHPSVRVVPMHANTPFSSARIEAMRLTTTPLIAFVEEHTTVLPGWGRALIAAHAAHRCAAVGAEVHNGNPEGALSRTIELMNYNLWMPPAPAGESTMLPGHNSSFKKEVLLAYGDELAPLFRAEVALYLRLRRDGHVLYLEPAAKFRHWNETRLSSICRGYFLWHRCYGPIRAAVFEWSTARRWLYICATPVIPIYYLVRLTGVLVRRRPHLLGRMFRGVPAIFVSQLASAFGQAFGLLFGIGDAERQFTDYELNHPRTSSDRGAPMTSPARDIT
ncbi:MAG: glycosyltransferase family 2 protein [Thermoanaerobaculia bacterium]